jgi:hypothetical protein
MSVISLPRIAALSPPQGRSTWKPFYWYSAMLLLLTLQLLSGTSIEFALLVSVFCLLVYASIMACGGLLTLPGLVILTMAVQHILVSQIAKLYFWQPADTNLVCPMETMLVYDIGMVGLYFGCLLSGRVAAWRKKPVFDRVTDPLRLMWLAYVSTAFAIFSVAYTGTQDLDPTTGTKNVGGIHGLLYGMGYLPPLSVAAGTAYMILSSHGKRSLGVINAVAIAVPLVFGIIGSGRQMMVQCVVIYYVTCFLFRFKFRPIHYGILVVGIYVAQFILFPYALYARNYTRTANFEQNVQRATSLLADVIANPIKYQEKSATHKGLSLARHMYYGAGNLVPFGTLDRYSVIMTTDGIVEGTLDNGTIGMETISPGFEMMVPRIFSPEKISGTRNTLAHRTNGLVGKKDFSTGITTGFISDSFSSYSWLGAFGIPFGLCLLLFSAYRLMFVGSLWHNVYAISLIYYLGWQFSELGIGSQIVLIVQGSLVTLCVFFTLNLLADSLSGVVMRLRKARVQEAMRPTLGLTLRQSGVLPPPKRGRRG